MARKQQSLWKQDGWELVREFENGKTRRVLYTLKSPGGRKTGWRLYTSRTSPHRVEVRFEESN
ncbi:MAG: hypothetical protein O7C73_03635 [Nitrospirae bacterium]|nr:hypothetical protein [Nitrospirota bacterium]MEC4670153.1 hypothetical protein [Nitrospirota bacterium]